MKITTHLNRVSENGDVFGIGTTEIMLDGVILRDERELAQAVAQAFHDTDPRKWNEQEFVAALWQALRKT